MSNHRRTSSPLRMLLWKEWRVWRWPFLLYAAVIVYGVLYDMVVCGNVFDPNATFCLMLQFYGFVAPVLVAVRAAAGEASQKTLSFSTALPYPLRWQAASRMAGATLVVIGGPLIGALVLSACILSPWGHIAERAFDQRIGWVLVLGKGVALLCAAQWGLMLLVSLVGAKRQSEVQVGAYGAVIATCQFLLQNFLPGMWAYLLKISPGIRAAFGWIDQDWCGALLPAALLNPFDAPEASRTVGQLYFAQQVWGPLALNLMILAGLAVWFTHRYGKPSRVSANDTATSWFSVISVTQRIVGPHSPRVALIWLNLRQTLPLVVGGWMMAGLTYLILTSLFEPVDTMINAGHMLMESLMLVGTLWPAVIGAGIYATELQSGLGNFWRSRPIAPTTWFWAKYLVGLSLVIVSLDLIPILAMDIVVEVHNRWVIYQVNHGIETKLTLYDWPTTGANLACLPMIHAASYTLAVLGVAWIRRPGIVAALCVPILMVIEIYMDMDPRFGPYSTMRIMHGLRNNDAGAMHHYYITYGTVFLLILLGAYTASRATQRNVLQPLTSSVLPLFDRLRRARATI